MNHIAINYELKIRGSSQAAIAAANNVDPSTVNKVMKGITTSAPIAKSISDLTGIPLRELFPDGRYSEAA